MATVLYPDGTTKEVTPQNGRDFKLAEIKVALGMTPNDMIAIVPTRDSRILVIDDEGKLKDLPRNEQATRLCNLYTPAIAAQEMLEAKARGIEVIMDPALLEDPDYIAGTALLCNNDEVQ